MLCLRCFGRYIRPCRKGRGGKLRRCFPSALWKIRHKARKYQEKKPFSRTESTNTARLHWILHHCPQSHKRYRLSQGAEQRNPWPLYGRLCSRLAAVGQSRCTENPTPDYSPKPFKLSCKRYKNRHSRISAALHKAEQSRKNKPVQPFGSQTDGKACVHSRRRDRRYEHMRCRRRSSCNVQYLEHKFASARVKDSKIRKRGASSAYYLPWWRYSRQKCLWNALRGSYRAFCALLHIQPP